MNIINHSREIIEVENFWSLEKCETYINLSEEMGYGPALVQTRLGQQRISHVRNNERVIFDNQELALEIWKDLKSIVPPLIGYSKAIGLNERFRFYKYEIGQEFKRHRDMSFIRNEFEASQFTFMIYLNDNFAGGATNFNDVSIKPKTGNCLLFYHPLEHEGAKIISGTKYVLRTDVMYKLVE